MYPPINSTIPPGMCRQLVSTCRCFVLWPNSNCTCAETAIFERSVKILTPLLDSSTPISHMVRIFWQSVDIHYVTLTFDPLTLNTSCSVSAVIHDQTRYQISAKSNKPRLSYYRLSDLKIEHLGTDLHFGFHCKWVSIIAVLQTHNAPMYKISAKSINLQRLSYSYIMIL